MSGQDCIDAGQRLHPAIARVRELRRRVGLPASLVDVAVLARVNSLFEHVSASNRSVHNDDHDAA